MACPGTVTGSSPDGEQQREDPQSLGGGGPGGGDGGPLLSPHVELLQHVVGLEHLPHRGSSRIPTAIVRDVQDPQEDVCLGHKGATPWDHTCRWRKPGPSLRAQES